ncbi:hypothetical protein AVEN_91400-1 [Araneus ventricosus]|uniref:Uncharacterized protein n=1 Tax=Araneus ventricosus TaxID=182803 RepID=A0A4Y2KEH5_ARAVE|nr:hypothetical protein AVEN_91400-1 [Araneus ventricosus]
MINKRHLIEDEGNLNQSGRLKLCLGEMANTVCCTEVDPTTEAHTSLSNASSASGEKKQENSLRMRKDCFQYASKTRRPKCVLPYKISPSELVFGKLPSFRSIPSLHRHLRMRMELNKYAIIQTDRQSAR